MFTGEITEELKNKLNEYYEHFKEHFPTMCYDNDDIISFINKCIKSNKPYKPKYKEYEDS